jgi:hypothetical protein
VGIRSEFRIHTLHGKADSSNEILPAKIRAQVVEHRKRQLDDPEHSLLICVLQPLECRGQIAESRIDDGSVEWGNVLLLGQGLQFRIGLESSATRGRIGVATLLGI